MTKSRYTCTDYRKEMILLSLQRRLNGKNLGDDEKKEILKEIEKAEQEMDMD